MPNWKINVTMTPNANVEAHPFSSDVIYATADNTGNVNLTWAATSAEPTRVVATYNGVDKIEVVNPEINIIPTAYKVYFDLGDMPSSQSTTLQNSGSLGGVFTSLVDGYFDQTGLVAPTSLGAVTLSTDPRYLGNLTMVARVLVGSATNTGYVIAFSSDGRETPDGNWLYSLKIGSNSIRYFTEYDSGTNSAVTVPFTFANGGLYTVAIVREVTSATNCTIYTYVDGVLIAANNDVILPNYGSGSIFYINGGRPAATGGFEDGFIGTTKAVLVHDDTLSTDEIAVLHEYFEQIEA